VLIIILLTSLPYLHEIITNVDGSLKKWVPDIGLQELLADKNGNYFRYKTYRYFLFTIFFNLFLFFGYLGWYRLETHKPYRKAILIPLFTIVYQLIIIVFSLRSSLYNEPFFKFLATFALTILLVYLYFPKRHIPFRKRIMIIWGLLFIVSLLPYSHDIINTKSEGLRWFIPNLGIEQLLTFNNSVMGYHNYRIFVFIMMIHVFAQIGWAGWFFDARNRLFRPFILVPVIFNMWEITILIMRGQDSGFNKPDWKLYAAIIFSILIAVNLYYNSDKALEWMENKSNKYNKKKTINE